MLRAQNMAQCSGYCICLWYKTICLCLKSFKNGKLTVQFGNETFYNSVPEDMVPSSYFLLIFTEWRILFEQIRVTIQVPDWLQFSRCKGNIVISLDDVAYISSVLTRMLVCKAWNILWKAVTLFNCGKQAQYLTKE